MSKFWDALDKVESVLGDIDETNKTMQHGYGKTRDTIDNADRTVKRFLSGAYAEDEIKIAEYEWKRVKCKIKTVILCIILIVITVFVVILF